MLKHSLLKGASQLLCWGLFGMVVPATAFAQEDGEAPNSAAEKPGETYGYVGVRYRNQQIPKFLQNLFSGGEGGESMYNHTPGLEFALRQDGFEYNIFGMLSFLGMDSVPFEGRNDTDVLDMDYSILYLGSDFNWSSDELAPGLRAVYGVGAGFGLVFGELKMTEAYPPYPGAPIDEWVRCPAPTLPRTTPEMANNCETTHADPSEVHYDKVEPSWFDGSSPLFMPWLAGNLGLRYQVTPEVMLRADLGITLLPPGSYFGLAAAYRVF